jgi:hypothetical protein
VRQAVVTVLSPESRKPFPAIFGAAWFPRGIMSQFIGAADVALMLVAVITLADAIGTRYLDQPAGSRSTKVVHLMAGKERDHGYDL